ncbi:hypothetical protein PR048_007638 [Dryococelus australis]|uniref:Uncharacterized protein n=1 Tax=Dryococelus australis TaxID=614101 RepID=A0ABQ9HUT1_9NEOP|nr:hypothetical protein PR048_007638 [Dryococelus australis]
MNNSEVWHKDKAHEHIMSIDNLMAKVIATDVTEEREQSNSYHVRLELRSENGFLVGRVLQGDVTCPSLYRLAVPLAGLPGAVAPDARANVKATRRRGTFTEPLAGVGKDTFRVMLNPLGRHRFTGTGDKAEVCCQIFSTTTLSVVWLTIAVLFILEFKLGIRHVPLNSGGSSGVVVRLLASHLDEPASIPGGDAPEFSCVGIVPDDATGRRDFSGVSHFPPSPHYSSAPHSPHYIGSQDLDV